VVLGGLVNRDAVARLRGLIDDAVGKGARMLAGGAVNGTVMAATVLDQVTPAMRIYHEETFGPVVAVVRAKDTDDAVRIANDTDYGLAGAVFGRDVARALNVARRIDCGVCHINAATVHDEPQLPFGGTKASGYGRFGGKAAIDAFTELRTITIATEAQKYPF
jgi:benzaldehyde dehydrogenase (NAD)